MTASIEPPRRVECDNCGGDGDHGTDEAGCRLACYACGMTGWITLSRQQAWRWQRIRRRSLARAAMKALAPPPPPPPPPMADDWLDDIPF